MKVSAAILLLTGALAYGYGSTAHAVLGASTIYPCTVGIGQGTRMCGESRTEVNGVESLIYADQTVSATFNGPAYSVGSSNSSSIVPIGFAQSVTVTLLPYYCAHSGYHDVSGIHLVSGRFEWVPTWNDVSFSSHIQHYCDCGSSPP